MLHLIHRQSVRIPFLVGSQNPSSTAQLAQDLSIPVGCITALVPWYLVDIQVVFLPLVV
jgi:hypothetical protein